MMRILATVALALAACAPSPPAGTQPRPIEELFGRVAGPPQRCVSISSQQSLRVSDRQRNVLLYGGGRTIWTNPLAAQCTFRVDDVLVMEPVGSSYCRGDIVRSFDRNSHIPGPACVLGDFIPYSRP